jgi:hypothetical protein
MSKNEKKYKISRFVGKTHLPKRGEKKVDECSLLFGRGAGGEAFRDLH